ncbi:MAG: xanthine dehydrogenase family protein subunit M [Dehalococcoidia bacterium]|nr:xanthine dehydrogenase family protein subunit M [Dehalococcoidia bacterium]
MQDARPSCWLPSGAAKGLRKGGWFLQTLEYTAPKTLKDAITLLAQKGDAARPLAGGTDVLVQLRVGRRPQVNTLVDLKNIPELTRLSYDPREGLYLGAAVACCHVYEDATVRRMYPGLIDAAELIGSVQIQGRASVGGNVCNAAPSGDTIPALIALSATCSIAGPNGTRSVPMEQFCTAPGRNLLQNGEILVAVRIPAPAPNSGAAYLRFIPRNEMDIAVAGVGASVVLDSAKQRITSARVALASVAPTPLFVTAAGQALAGKAVTDEAAIQAAADAAVAAARPITDMRGTIEFRKQLVGVLTRRTLHIAIQRARGA